MGNVRGCCWTLLLRITAAAGRRRRRCIPSRAEIYTIQDFDCRKWNSRPLDMVNVTVGPHSSSPPLTMGHALLRPCWSFPTGTVVRPRRDEKMCCLMGLKGKTEDLTNQNLTNSFLSHYHYDFRLLCYCIPTEDPSRTLYLWAADLSRGGPEKEDDWWLCDKKGKEKKETNHINIYFKARKDDVKNVFFFPLKSLLLFSQLNGAVSVCVCVCCAVGLLAAAVWPLMMGARGAPPTWKR